MMIQNTIQNNFKQFSRGQIDVHEISVGDLVEIDEVVYADKSASFQFSDMIFSENFADDNETIINLPVEILVIEVIHDETSSLITGLVDDKVLNFIVIHEGQDSCALFGYLNKGISS